MLGRLSDSSPMKTITKKLDHPIFLDSIPLVERIVNDLFCGKFIDKQRQYLLRTNEPRPRLFYMLPKIHKDRDEWCTFHQVPPRRPIVSDCSSETYHTAEFIDYFLNPLSTKHELC